MKKVIIVGGGAAGFFTAINIKELNSQIDVTILEKSNQCLSKVKISGGGRCNVTNAIENPKELVNFYPRGRKELLGPFYHFGTKEVKQWFEWHGIYLKSEEDGRVFPESDDSQTIINLFFSLCHEYGIKILNKENVIDLVKDKEEWQIKTTNSKYHSDYLVITPGSSKPIWKLLQKLNHNIIDDVPSLFSFNIKDKNLHKHSGLSANPVEIKVLNSKLTSKGSLLITHWGLSGPSILKISSYGARELHKIDYKFTISVNWLDLKHGQLESQLRKIKEVFSRKEIKRSPLENIPHRLWRFIIHEIDHQKRWGELSKKEFQYILNQLTQQKFEVTGKNTFKSEFVTAGGVKLKEINFKNFESKLHSNLFLAGEILNIDAITGGFNFQAAWTGGMHIAEAISLRVS